MVASWNIRNPLVMVAALAVKESLVMGVQAPLAGTTTWKKTLCETKSLALLEFLMAVEVLAVHYAAVPSSCPTPVQPSWMLTNAPEFPAKYPKIDDGSTTMNAILIGDCLFVANVGDSRAVMCKSGRAVAATRDRSHA